MSSATNFVTNIPVFEGAQGKYYIVEEKKYSVYFPIAWAHEHLIFQDGDYEIKTGPKECGNCAVYGSIRGVFVGYCGNCLRYYHDSHYWRGCLVAPGLSLDMLKDTYIWSQYPYMSGVQKSAIGDEEGADLTDKGVNLEQLSDAMEAAWNCGEADKETRSITPDSIFFHNPHGDTDDDSVYSNNSSEDCYEEHPN